MSALARGSNPDGLSETLTAKGATESTAPRPCLRRTVADAMRRDRWLEAVRIDRDRQSLAVATLGTTSSDAATAELSERIQEIRQSDQGEACALLAGTQDCTACPAVDSDLDSPALEIRQEGHRLTLARQTCPTAPTFWRWRETLLPRWAPREVTFSGEEDYDREWPGQLVAAGLCGLLALVGWISPAGPWSVALFVAAYGAGAWFPAVEVRERLQRGVLDIHFLMLAVAAGSAVIGAWGEGAVLLFLFSLSGALEHYAMGRTQREIRSLFHEAPKVAALLDAEGREIPTPVDALLPGMRLLIRPGEQFPVDAEVRRGETASDESTLTGEAAPVDKAVGDPVWAGTLNLWGSVEVGVLRPARESALQKVIQLIREAHQRKAPAQRFTDRFSTGYTYGVLGLSLGMFLFWWLVQGHTPWLSASGQTSAFYRAMTLLVVASPCALVLSIPSAVLAAIAWSARRGILFRGGAAVEGLAGIRTVAMDKTGTLTTGELRVDVVESFPPGRETEVVQRAFALEQLSQHPLARAVIRHGKHLGLTPSAVDRFESVSGQGVSAQLGDRRVFLGRRDWIERATGWSAAPGSRADSPGCSEIWLWSEDLAGRILLRDDLRPAAAGVVRELGALGLRVVVLTGDRPEAAESLRQHAGVQDVRAGLDPAAKVAILRQLSTTGGPVAMIGDGVNDAPSLAVADVGVAMGARGADAALEQAGVVLMNDRLENFVVAYRLSQRARRIIRQNLTVSLGTVVVLVGFALAGSIPLTVGVLGHEGSTVLVVVNSLRLLIARRCGWKG